MNAPLRLAYGETADPGFIRELCIALAHRWEPERLFLIFTAHFDEADSHGGAAAMTMGAFLGTGRQWELLGRRLNGLRQSNGFKVFHATEFKGRTGEFKGWSDEKGAQLINDLTEVVRDELTEGVVISLTREQYLTEYRNPPFPRKMPIDSQWGLCFRACMAQIAQTVRGIKGNHRINVVVEEGHPNAGASKVIFGHQKQALLEQGIDLYGTVTVAKKIECEPLMMADFLAHTFKMFDDEMRVTGKGYAELTDAQPRKGDAALSILNFPPGVLQGLKTEFERKQFEKHKDWLTRRAIWRASQQPGTE